MSKKHWRQNNNKKNIYEKFLSETTYYDPDDYFPSFDEDDLSFWLNYQTPINMLQLSQLLNNIRLASYHLYLTNPYYRGIILTYVKYIAGQMPILESDSEQANAKWKSFCQDTHFSRRFKQWVRRFFRDGETFLHLPTMTFKNPANIANPGTISVAPEGIEYDENNNEVAYYLRQDNNNFVRIDATEMLHTDETDDDEPRGIPYLLAIMERSKQLDLWLDDRLKLNRIRAMIALIRKHAATGTAIKSFSDSKADTTTKTGERIKKIKAGQIIDTNLTTQYEFLSPNLQATDVAEDGRNVRLTFSAMTGLPEFMISGDASNSNYASTMVAEGPGQREFEHWQDFFAEEILVVWHYVTESKEIPVVRFRPIISRKNKEETDRNQVLFQNGVISLAEWRRREGVDDQQMDEEINGQLQ